MKKKAVIIVVIVLAIGLGLFIYQQSSELEVTAVSPQNNSVVEGSSTQIEFSVTSSEDFEYKVFIDNRSIESLTLLEGQGEEIAVDTAQLAPGTHNWRVEVRSGSKESETGKMTFETEESPNFENPRFITIRQLELEDQTLQLQVVNSAQTNYTLYVNNMPVKQSELPELGLTPYNEVQADVSEIESPKNVRITVESSGKEYETLNWPISR